MGLQRFLYTSYARTSFTSADLAQLRLAAERENDRNDVTGLLVFDGARFAQLVEGPDAGLSIVIDRILADQRHGHVRTIAVGPVSERSFSGWALQTGWKQLKGASDPFVAAIKDAVDRVSDQKVKAFFIGFAVMG